jgi:hypothetical protein
LCDQEDGNWKKRWTFSAASTMPKLTSKQKCVQDNSGILADERENVDGVLASKQKCVQDNSGILANERENVDGFQHLYRRA